METIKPILTKSRSFIGGMSVSVFVFPNKKIITVKRLPHPETEKILKEKLVEIRNRSRC